MLLGVLLPNLLTQKVIFLMSVSNSSVEHTASQGLLSHSFVLFGALGDLSLRKLMPALYQLEHAGLLSSDLRIMGVARRPIDQAEFIQRVEHTLNLYIGAEELNSASTARFLNRLDYCQVNLTEQEDYNALKDALSSWHQNVTYYLATPPSLFKEICQNLDSAGAINASSRMVVEKPIGHDLESSKIINDALATYFDERQIFRIDHYLGKETVQNLIALRFANPLLENQWNNQHIDYVEISVAEDVGIEGRWGYFDQAGQMRDMVQNHLMQLLCLVAMEPPERLDSSRIRDEKVKVLQALKTIGLNDVNDCLVLGQYADGEFKNKPAPGYLNEPDANISSNTETFIALKVDIDNERWAGTPFYLRTGKRMGSKVTEIIVHFKASNHYIFSPEQEKLARNRLVIRLQPSESITLTTQIKAQGIDKAMELEQHAMQLNIFEVQADVRMPDAYERLLLEAIKGDQSLFVRRDEVEMSWTWCDQVRSSWTESNQGLAPYPVGSNGPQESRNMINKYSHQWHEDCNE